VQVDGVLTEGGGFAPVVVMPSNGRTSCHV
jgi:hypothetical protein